VDAHGMPVRMFVTAGTVADCKYGEKLIQGIDAEALGKANIFAAVVHMDEKTPHMHLCFTPITNDGRLCAKEIIGNRTQLTKWQDDFFEHMVKKFNNIERGEPARKTWKRIGLKRHG